MKRNSLPWPARRGGGHPQAQDLFSLLQLRGSKNPIASISPWKGANSATLLREGTSRAARRDRCTAFFFSTLERSALPDTNVRAFSSSFASSRRRRANRSPRACGSEWPQGEHSFLPVGVGDEIKIHRPGSRKMNSTTKPQHRIQPRHQPTATVGQRWTTPDPFPAK